MADISWASANNMQQWNKTLLMEFVRGDVFNKYTGKETSRPIQVVEDLTKMPGNQVTQSLVTRLTNNATTGDNTLWGNEEDVGDYAYTHTVNQLRHAVRIGKHEQSKTHIEAMKIAGPLLADWRVNNHRDAVIAAMLCPNVDGSTSFASSTEGAKDTWVAANTDRVLFGNAVANYSAGDHSASLTNIDATNDTLDSGILSLTQRRAKTADPHIRPVMVKGYGEYYVWFVPSLAMRDLETDSTIINAQQYAMQRGKDNPLFTDGDVLWRGNIVHEVPEISTLADVGDGGTVDVAPCFCCGAQAIGYAIGERVHNAQQEFDYGNLKGKAIVETSVVNKLIFNNVQHGMHTTYVSGQPDG